MGKYREILGNIGTTIYADMSRYICQGGGDLHKHTHTQTHTKSNVNVQFFNKQFLHPHRGFSGTARPHVEQVVASTNPQLNLMT